MCRSTGPRYSTPAADSVAMKPALSSPRSATRRPRSVGSWVPRCRRTRRSSTHRNRISARARTGWASMACPAEVTASTCPVRSKRLPAMMRMPGPSQVSSARASSPVTARDDGVALGVSSRSLTTMTRRPRGTSTRVPPGSRWTWGRSAGGPGSSRSTVPSVSVVVRTARPFYGACGVRLRQLTAGAPRAGPWPLGDVRSGPTRPVGSRIEGGAVADQHSSDGSGVEGTEATSEDYFSEDRVFPPPPEFAANALVNDPAVYDEAARLGPEFWATQAGALDWFRPWDTVLDWDLPFARWFDGGTLNVSYNCLDRHIAAGRGDKVAFHWEGEPGDTRTISYGELLDEVSRFANVLKGLGVGRGDRVAIYMPMVPELAVAMLACTRIGAVHSVVFGGFSSDALRDRIL